MSSFGGTRGLVPPYGYATPPIAKDELLARIRADATVSEPVRERALEFARQRRKE